MKRWRFPLALVGVACVAAASLLVGRSNAQSSTIWSIQGIPTQVGFLDTRNGGTFPTSWKRSIAIFFPNSANICGASTNQIIIAEDESPQFDAWLRMTEGAILSGKPLLVQISNRSAGTCKAYYLGLNAN